MTKMVLRKVYGETVLILNHRNRNDLYSMYCIYQCNSQEFEQVTYGRSAQFATFGPFCWLINQYYHC